ncbi:MAG: hypothetical protein JKP90_00250 [Desulfofustis sp. PB-SRB1]|nr:hypothetical protein [Desulfofustis sp. PB-SRB1]
MKSPISLPINIAEIGKERIRRVIKKLKGAREAKANEEQGSCWTPDYLKESQPFFVRIC